MPPSQGCEQGALARGGLSAGGSDGGGGGDGGSALLAAAGVRGAPAMAGDGSAIVAAGQRAQTMLDRLVRVRMCEWCDE
eukprot:361484-Chlamydomonas_euryale.AAC.3